VLTALVTLVVGVMFAVALIELAELAMAVLSQEAYAVDAGNTAMILPTGNVKMAEGFEQSHPPLPQQQYSPSPQSLMAVLVDTEPCSSNGEVESVNG